MSDCGGAQGQELETAYYAFVMADCLMAGNSAFSVSASWLSKGWVWAYASGAALPPHTTMITWENGTDTVTVETVFPPRWPRQSGR